MISSIARQTWESWVTFNKETMSISRIAKGSCSRCLDCRTEEMLLWMLQCFLLSLYGSVFGWLKKNFLRSFYFLFFHKMLDTFSPMIFDLIDTSTLKHAESAASSNRVNLPIEMTSFWHRLFHMFLFSAKKSHPSLCRAAVAMGLQNKLGWDNLLHKEWPCKDKERSHTVDCGTV